VIHVIIILYSDEKMFFESMFMFLFFGKTTSRIQVFLPDHYP